MDKRNNEIKSKKIIRILEKIREKSEEDGNRKFEDLYSLIKEEAFAHLALNSLMKNKGINTPGADNETLDGFGSQDLSDLSERLKKEQYEPGPVKRIYIPKPGKEKKRPLGQPNLRDKIVQQMIYEILSAIYEPVFTRDHEDSNYGFRRNRSIRDAIQKIERKGKDTRWCIEGDIEGAYDNVKHGMLLNILEERVGDKKVIRLIKKMLESGVMEKSVYRPTEKGTPQGGIISPMLFNIYMSRMDEYVIEKEQEDKKRNEEEGRTRTKRNPEYTRITNEIGKRVTWIQRKEKKLGEFTSWPEEIRDEAKRKQGEIKELNKQRRKHKSIIEEESPRRQVYVRYADDWIILMNVSKERAIERLREMGEFLSRQLGLTLSQKKTKITDLRRYRANFLGFSIGYSKDPKIKKGTRGRRKRTTGTRLRIGIDDERMMQRMKMNGFMNDKGETTSKRSWTVKTDYEIVENFNWVIRGLLAYWSQGVQFYYVTHRYINGLELSCVRTLSHKRKISRMKVRETYTKDGRITATKETEEGRRTIQLIQWREGVKLFRDMKKKRIKRDSDNPKALVNWRTSMKLKESCQICGKTENLEMHHVNKIKNIKLKGFKKIMAQLNRKQIVVCKECHRKIHKGTYDGMAMKDIKA